MVPKTLKWLDLHQNQLSALENYFAVEQDSWVAHLDASFNQIKELGPQNLPNRVETLLLNDNRIDTLVPYTFFKKTRLRKVDLSVNKLETIDRNSLRLHFDNDEDDADKRGRRQRQQPKFYLGGNPIRCDCHMAWFKTVNSVDVNSLQNFPYVADLESIYCQLLYARERSFMPLVEAHAEDFLCSYKTHCFSLCHCCDYDACDCEMTCPANCTCYHDTTWSKNIAECSSAEFQDLPDQLPMDATEIFLDGNDIGELRSHTFIGRKNLKVLYLNNSKILSVENHTFNGLAVLEELHLEENSIGKLQGDEFHGLALLRELHLQDNRIASVNNATFRNLKSLKVLNLSGNQIRDFPVWQLSANSQLSRVHLAGNPWTCKCRFVATYRRWLAKARDSVMDAASVICYSGSNSAGGGPEEEGEEEKAVSILHGDFQQLLNCLPPPPPSKEEVSTRLQRKDLTLTSSDGSSSSSSSTEVGSRRNGKGGGSGGSDGSSVFQDFLPIFLGVIAAFVLVVVLLVAAFAYRDEARLWLYSKYGVRFFHRVDGGGGGVDADADKLFDAFLAYSAKDDAFVRQMLAQELELPPVPPPPPPPPPLPSLNGGHSDHYHHAYASHTLQQHLSSQYKLCLLYRDLPIQQAPYHLSDTVVQAAEAARRTILVLSEHFVKSEWSRYDFKSGLHQALSSTCHQRGRRKRGPRRLVVVLLGDVGSRRDLDPDLRMYLKSAVVLQWGDRLFWEKLRYALPDVGGGSSSSSRRRRRQQQQQQQHPHLNGGVHAGKRQLSQLSQLSQLTEAFSPDNSFRYETYGHHHRHQPPPPHQPPAPPPAPPSSSSTTHPRSVRSAGGSSSGGGTYQSVGTPDEQESTRTMTIHI